MGKLKLYTYSDYFALADGKRYELIHGELIEMAPAPNDKHQRIEVNLVYYLKGYIKQHQLGGHLRCAPYDVILSDHDVVQPDLLFISGERANILRENNCEGAPDLAVEILSPRSVESDRNTKAQLYFEHGVMEYWIVDPTTECVEVHRRGDSGFTLHAKYQHEALIRSQVFLNLDLQAKQAFED